MPINRFSDPYKEMCFYAWYKADKPGFQGMNTNVVDVMPPDANGNKPVYATLARWYKDDDWELRAQALDAEVSVRLDEEVIEERVKTLRELADSGKKLKEKGLEYLNSDSPFKDNPSAAVRAVIAGAEMEFKYAGQADILANISSMSNKQLDRELARLLGKNENEIIDAEEAEPDESEADND